MRVRRAMRYTHVCASAASPQAARNDTPFLNEMRYALVDEPKNSVQEYQLKNSAIFIP